MLEALEDDYHPSQIAPPFAKGHPIPHDMSSWHLTSPHRNNLGLAIPDINQPFALANQAWHMLYHGRPDTPNQFISMAFNYALQVHYHSVFGFELAWALCPTSPSSWASFVHHFAGIVAIPGRYAEYLTDSASHPPPVKPFVSPSVTIILTWMDIGC